MATKADLAIVERLDDIPSFGTEAEEAAYWSTHQLSERLWATLPAPEEGDLPPVRLKSSPLAVRFDQDVLARLKALAKKKHTGYQTLLKQFVAERLYEEEKREGIIPQ